MARFGKHFLLALLLGIGLLFGLPGQVRAEETLTPNLPRDPGDAPEAVVISSEITEEAEVEKIPAVGDRFTPSKWVCELSVTANKWLKGDRIIIPFTLYSYEAKYGEHDEKMYAYLVNEAGDVIGYYEDAFTAGYETKTVTLEIQGAQALEVGTYYMIYYSTYEKGNLNGRPIPIYVEEYDPVRQYSYVDIPWDTVGKHFSCGELQEICFDIYPLGYVGHEYFYGLYDSEYNLIYGDSGYFKYGIHNNYVGVIDISDLQGDLRPGTYYLRTYSTLHDKYKDRYFPFYIDNKGTGNTFDEQTGTLTFFGSGEMQKCKEFHRYRSDVRHVIVEPGITTVRDDFCNRFSCLESVSLPNGLVSIGWSAFRETALKTIAIPNTVTNIEPWAFEDCAQLETVTTFGSWMEPGDSMRMNGSTFVRCSALTRLEIPSSVTRLGLAMQVYMDLMDPV